jgi:hypothetical protein
MGDSLPAKLDADRALVAEIAMDIGKAVASLPEKVPEEMRTRAAALHTHFEQVFGEAQSGKAQ